MRVNITEYSNIRITGKVTSNDLEEIKRILDEHKEVYQVNLIFKTNTTIKEKSLLQLFSLQNFYSNLNITVCQKDRVILKKNESFKLH